MKSSLRGVDSDTRLSSNLRFEAAEIHFDAPIDPVPDYAAHGFMQSVFWAHFKIRTGWKAYSVKVASTENAFRDEITVLARSPGLGQWFAYVPHGPSSCPLGIEPADYLSEIGECVLPLLPSRPLFIRFDLPWDKHAPESQKLAESMTGYGRGVRRGKPVQVPDTTVLDLSLPESELLDRMKPKWRYNIRLAEKKGVRVTRHGKDALDAFYTLYLTTARRDGIAIHPKSYYADLLEEGERYAGGFPGGESPIAIWLADHDEEILAGIITIFLNRQAVYLYGASSDSKRNLMPAYALQWSAIRAAKSEGCREYDFFGIPPGETAGHAMAGLYLFKTGFGGTIVHRLGAVDLTFRPPAAAIFSALEDLRNFWHKKIVKKIAALSRSLRTRSRGLRD